MVIEPTVPIPMSIEFTARSEGLVDVPISLVIEATEHLCSIAARQGLSQPDIADILAEVALKYECVGWYPGLDYEVEEIEYVDALIDDTADIKAVSVLIAAELGRLADEADPDRARFRPTPGQMDIFGQEITE